MSKLFMSVVLLLFILFSSVSTSFAQDEKLHEALKRFVEVSRKLYSELVQKPDPDKMIDAAIEGMVNSVDKHGSYINRAQFRELTANAPGHAGIGAALEKPEGLTGSRLFIRSISESSLLKSVGVAPGDYITAIDGKEVKGQSLSEAYKSLRGKAGSSVELSILRNVHNGNYKTMVSVKRKIYAPRTITYKIQQGMDILSLINLTDDTLSQLSQAMRKMDERKSDAPKAYILDLRNCPGGLLSAAIDVANGYLERGVIVSVRGRIEKNSEYYKAKSGDLAKGRPIIVLVNKKTAAGCEIIAGALQDHRRAKVLGTKTFGRGTLQTIYPLLKTGGAIRVTTARFYRPNGSAIEGKGITPDVTIVQSKDGKDTQLEKAISILKAKISN